MNNKTRIIIGIVVVVLFLIGIFALDYTQHVNSSEPTKITNQNDTQIQIINTDKIDVESIAVVKCSLKDKSNFNSLNMNNSFKVNSKLMNNSFKVNSKLKNKSNEVQFNTVKEDILPTATKSWFSNASSVEKWDISHMELKE